jgi:hypothetical protein
MSTAISQGQANPRWRKNPAIAQGFILWTSADATDVGTSPTFQWGTGAPTHTAATNSIWWRTDAADSDLTFYRNTDGAATWETIIGSELTDLLAAANAWTNTNDYSRTITGTDELINADVSVNHATQVGVAVDATAVQLTTARTAGYAAAFRGKTTSLAGDLNAVRYPVLMALAPTDGAGSATHLGVYVEAGNDYGIYSEDNVRSGWGTGASNVPDVSQWWDAAKLVTVPAVDDSLWEIGDGTLSMDVTIYGASAAAHTKWDASANTVTFTGFVPTFASGFASSSTQDQNAIIDQDTTDAAGTGDAYDTLAVSTFATGNYGGINSVVQQLTNAATAGLRAAVKGSAVGLAGDTAGATYAGLSAPTPTVNGGSAIYDGLYLGSGWTNDIYFADTSANMVVQDAAGAALTIEDAGGNDFLVIDTAAVDGMTFGNATTNPVYTFLGSGGMAMASGTAAFGVETIGTSLTMLDASVLNFRGFGTGQGDIVEQIGKTATEGWQLRVYDETVNPAAIETNLLNLPAGSVILSVQANVESALTGGGTTVTWSIGTAGDPDHYGSAGFSSITGAAAADTLAKNSKVNWSADSAHAWAMSSAAEQLVLTGAATGGASDGNTALSVGSVRCRVLYYQMLALDNAA